MSSSVPVALFAQFAFLAFAFAWGCDSRGIPAQQGDPQPDPAYRAVLDARQTMEWILDPAADVIWDSAGFVTTAEGETDLSPTTDAGWERVRSSAGVVAEAGNLLLMPGRSAGPDWDAFARGLTGAGELALAAAEARDAAALFDAGGQIYQVCRACHTQYMLPLEEAQSTR